MKAISRATGYSGAGLAARGALAVLLGSIAGEAMAQTVSGTATYKERIALPAGAVFEAAIEDVSKADAAAIPIANTRLADPGNPPIAFTIPYDPAKILPNSRYVVRARILVGGKPMFTSDTAAPVITRGAPTKVSLLLRRASEAKPTTPATPPAGLQGTSWQLVRFQGGDEKVLTPDDRSKYTIQFGAGGRVSARIDCNRGSGAWKSSGPNQLEFGPLALTRAMCAPESMHDQVARQWTNIRSYVIKDGHLFLSLMADGGIYEYEPLPKK